MKDDYKYLESVGRYTEIEGERVLTLPLGVSLLPDTIVLYDEYSENRMEGNKYLHIDIPVE